jgi:hypothetical protein
MDYGEGLEDAWENHVANYELPPPLMSGDGKTEEPLVTFKEAHENKGPLDVLVLNNLREMHYFVKPYVSKQNSPRAFHHAIGIRDESFPAQQKN